MIDIFGFADKARSCDLNLLQSVDKVLGTADTWTADTWTGTVDTWTGTADTWTGTADTWTIMELFAASDQTHCALVVFDSE